MEFFITKDQYTKLPERERQNWHNHAVELTPERGMPSCVSLPQGVECGKLVETLQGTYGKVVTLRDPADAVPDYPPYVFAVDSPFALGQDLNNNLAKLWATGCGNTSSVAIPADIQKRMGIKKGDGLLLISKCKKIVLEKMTHLKDEFKEVEAFSELSLKKIWFNKKYDVWDQYLTE